MAQILGLQGFYIMKIRKYENKTSSLKELLLKLINAENNIISFSRKLAIA